MGRSRVFASRELETLHNLNRLLSFGESKCQPVRHKVSPSSVPYAVCGSISVAHRASRNLSCSATARLSLALDRTATPRDVRNMDVCLAGLCGMKANTVTESGHSIKRI